jgi:hypothetical protein
MQERAIKKQLDSMMALAEKDPELATQLQSRLKKMQMAAAASRKASETGEPTGEATESKSEE